VLLYNLNLNTVDEFHLGVVTRPSQSTVQSLDFAASSRSSEGNSGKDTVAAKKNLHIREAHQTYWCRTCRANVTVRPVDGCAALRKKQ
jgi:Zn finger protein HypA/HybF involved in hydrogenase expression